MKIAEILKTILWFRIPEPERSRSVHSLHASRWGRWCKAVIHDARGTGKIGLHRRIFAAIKQDIMLALVAIGVHTVLGFGAAITLKSLLTQLVQGDSPVLANITQGAFCLALTHCAWLALNHTFFLADVVGVGSRSYVEQRILLKRAAAQSGDFPLSLTTLFDREAARIESSWSGLVTIGLALATIIFTSTFFFFSLGISAVAILAVIAGSSLTVFRITQRLRTTYEEVSLNSTQRIAIGTFAKNNWRQAWLKNWNAELIRDYTATRNLEEASMKKAARLVAAINLISTMTPIAALLSSAVLQLAYLGHVDAPGMLAAIALIGGLRSVANNIPYIVQNISQGFVGHQYMEQYLNHNDREASSPDNEMLTMPSTTAKHIAIVGIPSSGKTSVLKNCAQRFPQAAGQSIFIPNEPWIFTGGLRQNLGLYRRDFSDESVRNAITLSRLPEQFYLDYLNEPDHGAIAHWDVSRGQGKRVELARALLAQPAWLYIDNPTAGLDKTLASGLLKSLLQGPWRDTRVMFVTNDPEEQDAAEEVWTVSNGIVTSVQTQHAAASSRLVAAPVIRPVSVLSAPEAESPMANDPAEQIHGISRSITRSLISFGMQTITLSSFTLLALKEVFTIAGDYLIASSHLSTHLHASLIGLTSIFIVSALLSISGAFMTTRKSIEAASAQCIRYFSHLMNPSLDACLTQKINRGSQNKLTWDQRRIDEVLPVLLLETVGAASLLSVSMGYIVLNNIYLLFPFILIGLCYWRGARRSGVLLQSANSSEIDATSALFSLVQALNWDGGRFDSTVNSSCILDWLSAKLAVRAFASLDNAATRRWYSYKLDVMGILFLSGIVASTIYFHSTGTATITNVLTVSLSYSLIAIFSRLGRCGAELRQVLDSADRLAVVGTFPAPAPIRQQSRDNAPLVTFSNVTFVNPRSGSTVLEQFDHAFYAKDVVVIMGASGVGKSTFANLVVGSLLPSLGQISTLGSTGGYLALQHAQEVQLLTSSPIFKPGSLAEHFNSPSRQALYQRAAYMGLSDIVERLPEGFDQQVSWTGKINLSKSELQRLALLDLTINTPAIVILDEATSELSSAEEVQLIKKVITALPQTLFFIITHNPELSTLGNRNFNFNHKKRLVEQIA